jgi:hypothetical protein
MALSTRSTRPTLGVTRARQGRLGRNVLWVLVFGLLLVVLGFFAAYTWRAGDMARVRDVNQQASPSAARTFNAPPPAASTRQNYQEGGPLAPQNGANPGQ